MPLPVAVPADCVASNTEADTRLALDQMARVLKAGTRPSADLSFRDLAVARPS